MAASTAAVTGFAPAGGRSRRGRLLAGRARTTIHVACLDAVRAERHPRGARRLRAALNLDGGGSISLVSGAVLQNLPRRDFEEPEPGGRPISTALGSRPLTAC